MGQIKKVHRWCLSVISVIVGSVMSVFSHAATTHASAPGATQPLKVESPTVTAARKTVQRTDGAPSPDSSFRTPSPEILLVPNPGDAARPATIEGLQAEIQVLKAYIKQELQKNSDRLKRIEDRLGL